jgi:DHA1 family bicyclomycin/chloramphenicol resistance-like MFS transporter
MVLLVGTMSIFGPICIDSYLPSLPAIGRDLHAGASLVQTSLTSCLVGLAVGQMVIGPLSDRFGRRTPLRFGLVGFIIASLGCALAPNILTLILLRFLQGVGGAAGLVTARAVVRDQYSGLTAARFFSLLMLVTGTGPLLAPQLGAALLHFGSWRLIFVSFVAMGMILLTISVFVLPETLPPENRHGGGITVIMQTLRQVGSSRAFLVNAIASAIVFGALFAYIAGSSFAFENVYGLSPQYYSLLFGLNAVGMIIASQINGRLVSRYGAYNLMTVGLFGLGIGGVALLVFVSTGTFGVAGLVIPTILVMCANGFVGPNSQALALNDFPKAAGSASALLGVFQFAVGAIAAPLVGLGGSHDAMPMAILMAGFGIAAVSVRLLLATPPAPSAPRTVEVIAQPVEVIAPAQAG